MYRARHRFGELIMQWPSESDAKTTEPGQREAVKWALCVLVRIRWFWGWEKVLKGYLLPNRRNGVEKIVQNQHRLRCLPGKGS